MKRIRFAAVMTVLSLVLSIGLMGALTVGCAHNPAAPPTPAALAPGAVNQFDQDSYKALKVAQASINSFKQSVATDPNLSNLKPAVNQAIQDYNVAEIAWKTYHATATVQNQAALQNSLNVVSSDVSNIQKAVQP